ncbi:GNAT family N-acetyltransferase [Paenibacillus filicis]|uniref:GNAT family N-acetyltransferase n=1 Tax=Paenibacillus filicis TaxID=669464 RepID=A0ABU9DVJ0_9BACL
MMIRKAVTGDLIVIQDMIAQTVEVMHEEGSDQWNASYPTILHFEQDMEHQSLYVKEAEQGVIACITIDQKLAPSYLGIPWSEPDAPAATFHRLAVSPYARQGGLAKELIHFAESVAFAQGIRWMRIDTYSLNHKAQALFTRLGYVKRGELVYPDKSKPFYFYEKEVVGL